MKSDSHCSRHSALIIVDMQNDFVRQGAPLEVPDARGTVETHRELIAAFRRRGAMIVYTKFLSMQEPCLLWNWSPQCKPPIKCCWKGHKRYYADVGRELECTAIIDELTPATGEVVIEKFGYGAFHGTPLNDILRNRSISTLLVTGTVTQICVEETAREAFHHGFRTTILADAVSSYAPDLHAATLKNFAMKFGWVTESRLAKATRMIRLALASALRIGSDRQHGIFWLLLVALTAAAIYVPDFRTAENLGNVIVQSTALGILAIGQTFVILCGLIDLSVGQLLGLCVVMICGLSAGRPGWFIPSVLAALGLGAAVGAVNGLLNNWLRIHPLILTFGMLSILQGTIFLYTDRSIGQAPPQLVWLANGKLLGLPVALFVLIAAALAAHFVLSRTQIGRHVYAVGGIEEFARRGGIDVGRIKLFAFVMSGLSAGLAGLLVAGRIGTGYPNAGAGYELDAIVAVVLGGTSLAGGAGSVIGPVAAALVLGLISNVLNLLQISAFVQILAKELIVIVAILLNQPER